MSASRGALDRGGQQSPRVLVAHIGAGLEGPPRWAAIARPGIAGSLLARQGLNKFLFLGFRQNSPQRTFFGEGTQDTLLGPLPVAGARLDAASTGEGWTGVGAWDSPESQVSPCAAENQCMLGRCWYFCRTGRVAANGGS